MIRYYKKEYCDFNGVTTVVGKFDDEKTIEQGYLDYVSDALYIEVDKDYLKVLFDKDIVDKDEFEDLHFIDKSLYDQYTTLYTKILEVAKNSVPPYGY